jgi:hypothetical protein
MCKLMGGYYMINKIDDEVPEQTENDTSYNNDKYVFIAIRDKKGTPDGYLIKVPPKADFSLTIKDGALQIEPSADCPPIEPQRMDAKEARAIIGSTEENSLTIKLEEREQGAEDFIKRDARITRNDIGEHGDGTLRASTSYDTVIAHGIPSNSKLLDEKRLLDEERRARTQEMQQDINERMRDPNSIKYNGPPRPSEPRMS